MLPKYCSINVPPIKEIFCRINKDKLICTCVNVANSETYKDEYKASGLLPIFEIDEETLFIWCCISKVTFARYPKQFLKHH